MLKRCLTLVGLLYVLSLFNISDAAAKICFLPDGSCGTGKITKFDPDSKSGCMYKTEAEARNGLGECETVYPKKPCYYRKCNSNNTTIFNDLDSCKKKLDTNQECTSCGSCYKIVTKSDNTTPDDDTTCTTKADCDKESKAFESNNTYDSNGNECGTCKPVESCPKGYYTIYQSQSDCLTGETFSSSGTANGKVCGKCTYQCSDYTLTSAKDSNCYSCSSCQYDTSKYKCTENVKSGYQLVNGVCSTISVTPTPANKPCKEINSKYINVDDNYECPNPNDYDYDMFETVATGVTGTDGECYECRHLKCSEYDSDYGTSSMSCPTGFYKEFMAGYVGSDGQCYDCRRQITNVVFEYYREEAEAAGDYCADGNTWNGSQWVSDYFCHTSLCEPRHKSNWDMYLVTDNEADDFNHNAFILPFELKIVVTYKVPYIYRGGDCRYNPTINWNVTSDPLFEPKTVTMTFPAGTKLGATDHITVKDYSGDIAPQTIKYYIDGRERSSYTTNNVKYSFQEI